MKALKFYEIGQSYFGDLFFDFVKIGIIFLLLPVLILLKFDVCKWQKSHSKKMHLTYEFM